MIPKLVDAKEAGRILNLNKFYIYLLARKKQLPAYRIGRILRFDESELSKWLETKKQGVR